ncbi:MAG: hypothetical protein HGB18_02975 [Candidatus Moranbacteria bacterium]|nr:hypothetical protein [Candidatus Moranbacteria bacterium]
MERTELLKKIEQLRGSKAISYVTSDRQGPVNARIAMDIIPYMSEQLRSIGKVPKIDLVLFSAGGDTMVPWRLVSMIREYCDTFSVLVPYKAHSAATMISLGADEIVMTDMGELTPIDPSTANPFNPSDPQNVQNKIPISVEEVMAYFDLAKNRVGITEEAELTKVFNKLTESTPSVHPLALGNVNRTYKLIRILAKRLLGSHREPLGESEIEMIIDALTEKLYSHQYVIGRREAKEDLGIKSVSYADDELASLLASLYESYRDSMGLHGQWNPEAEVGEFRAENKKDYVIAAIESAGKSNRFEIRMEFKKTQQVVPQQTPQGIVNVQQEQVSFRIVNQGWK